MSWDFTDFMISKAHAVVDIDQLNAAMMQHLNDGGGYDNHQHQDHGFGIASILIRLHIKEIEIQHHVHEYDWLNKESRQNVGERVVNGPRFG